MNENATKKINEFSEEIITSTEYLSLEYLLFSILKGQWSKIPLPF